MPDPISREQASLLDQLQALPSDWPLVAVDGEKRAYQKNWQQKALSHRRAATEIRNGRARAIGVVAGPPAGILFVDHDGPSASDALARLGIPVDSLPPTLQVTSGRDGRFALLYRVPERYWASMRQRRFWYTGEPDPATGKPARILGDDGKAEQLDLRWAGHYQIVIGAHPITGAYRWIHGPGERDLAEAPVELIELMLAEPDPVAVRSDPQPPMPPPPAPVGTIPLLDMVSRDTRQLIESGGTPGCWNDDQMRLSLDLIGTEAWIRAQGHSPDMTAQDAFEIHVRAARAQSQDFDERKAWRRFHGAESRSCRPSTPERSLADRLRYHTRGPRQDPPRAEESTEPGSEPQQRRSSGDHPYTLLGFDGDAYYYQPRATGQILRLTRSAHTSTNLVALAPLEYWEAIAPSKTGANWTQIASLLFQQQAAVGVYQPNRIRGRGVWWDRDQPVIHLGDRLIVDGVTHPIGYQLPGSRALYQRLGALDGPGDAEAMADAEAAEILSIAERFRWDVPASGLLLAGWTALAPICGALPWRPHIWLTGAAGTGKSAILDDYVRPLLGDLAVRALGNTTEAGIRQTLRADALPVVFDEAESNERADQQRIQSVLSLARVASSESAAVTIKGSADGEPLQFTIRSMFLFSSIAHGLRQGADLSRFAQLTLRSPADTPQAEREAHWRALSADLAAIVTPDAGRRLQRRMIGLIPAVRQSIGICTAAAASHFGSQRMGDQYGAMLAGAWHLMAADAITADQARALIGQNNWESYSSAVELPDEERCLRRILQHQVRVEASQRVVSRSVGELVGLVAVGVDSDPDVTVGLAAQVLARNGLRVDDGHLLVSNTAEAIREWLDGSPWASCWNVVLARLPGASRARPVRFGGTGSVSRAVRLPVNLIDQLP
jgi:putative DNA primase/helicase